MLLSAVAMSAQQKIINRYGLELLRVKGGYRLLDEAKIVKDSIFDINNVPADMYVPYTRSRCFLTDDDFHNCETIEVVYKKYPGYELKLAFDLPNELAVGVMLVGCCPGGTASNVMTFLARGDVPLSVTITSCTTILAPFVTPALMYLFASQWLAIDPVSMCLSIVQIVLVPIGLGVLVHKLAGDKIEAAVMVLPMVSVVAIVLIVAAVVAASANQILSAGALVFAVVVLHNGFGMLFGYLVGKVCGMNLAKRKCLAIEVGMQNSGLGVALATVHFAANPLSALPSAIFSFWHNISGPIMATIFHGWHEEGEEASFLEKIEARAQQRKA